MLNCAFGLKGKCLSRSLGWEWCHWGPLRLVSAGPVAWTGKRLQPDWTATKCNQTTGCGCMLFGIKNHWKLSATGFRYSLKIHTFWVYFEEKQPRNAWDMAKMICFGKIQLCAMSCSCIFWHVEYFYHHKNYMVSYYTLCSIFYNWFYIKKYQF